MDKTKRTTDGPRGFVYQGNVPPLLGLLLMAPLLLVFLSVAAALVAGGTVAAVVLPWFLRHRFGAPKDTDCIELPRDQYTRVDDERRRLPPA
jgi:hypothetical protein